MREAPFVSIGRGAANGIQVVDQVNYLWLSQARNHGWSGPRAMMLLLLLCLLLLLLQFRPATVELSLFPLSFSRALLQRYRFPEHEQTSTEIRSEIGDALLVDKAETTGVSQWVHGHVHYHCNKIGKDLGELLFSRFLLFVSRLLRASRPDVCSSPFQYSARSRCFLSGR